MYLAYTSTTSRALTQPYMYRNLPIPTPFQQSLPTALSFQPAVILATFRNLRAVITNRQKHKLTLQTLGQRPGKTESEKMLDNVCPRRVGNKACEEVWLVNGEQHPSSSQLWETYTTNHSLNNLQSRLCSSLTYIVLHTNTAHSRLHEATSSNFKATKYERPSMSMCGVVCVCTRVRGRVRETDT